MTIQIVTLNLQGCEDWQAAYDFKKDFSDYWYADGRPSAGSWHSPTPVVFCLQGFDPSKTAHLAGDGIFLCAPESGNAPAAGLFVLGAQLRGKASLELGPPETAATDAQKPSYGHKPRTAVLGEIKLGKKLLWVASLHLGADKDRSLTSPTRLAQIELFKQALQDKVPADAPLVIAGDFNATPDNPDLAFFQRGFEMAPVWEPTKTTPQGGRQVDHVFYRGLRLPTPPEVSTPTFLKHKVIACDFKL